MNLLEIWRAINNEARALKRYDEGAQLLMLCKDFVRESFRIYYTDIVQERLAERFVRQYGAREPSNFLFWILRTNPLTFKRLPEKTEAWLPGFILVRLHYDRFCKDAAQAEGSATQVERFIDEMEEVRTRIAILESVEADSERIGLKACLNLAFNWICTYEYFFYRFSQSPFRDEGGNFWYYDQFRLHNQSGPAVVMADGHVEFWLDDVMYDNELAWRCVAEVRSREGSSVDMIRVERASTLRCQTPLASFKLTKKRSGYVYQTEYKTLAKRFFARKKPPET